MWLTTLMTLSSHVDVPVSQRARIHNTKAPLERKFCFQCLVTLGTVHSRSDELFERRRVMVVVLVKQAGLSADSWRYVPSHAKALLPSASFCL